jgi:hypothetical protein
MNENTNRTEIRALQNEVKEKANELNVAIQNDVTIGKAKKIYFELKAIKGRLKNRLQE